MGWLHASCAFPCTILMMRPCHLTGDMLHVLFPLSLNRLPYRYINIVVPQGIWVHGFLEPLQLGEDNWCIYDWQAPLTREPTSPLTFASVKAIDWRLICVGMRVFTCSGTHLFMEPPSKCCSHHSARGCNTKPRKFTCETTESGVSIIIGLSSFALSTRSFIIQGITLNVHKIWIYNTMDVKCLPDAMPF